MIEDLDLFLADFGVDATLTIAPSATRSIRVLFDEEYVPTELIAEGRQIVACAKREDAIGVNHGHSLTIGELTYKIVGVYPVMDGRFVDLHLKE